MHPTKKRDLCYALFAIAFINFLLFLTITQFAGGVADHIANGRYYVSEHGRLAIVSPVVYYFTRVHLIITAILMLIGVPSFAIARNLHRELEEYDPITKRST